MAWCVRRASAGLVGVLAICLTGCQSAAPDEPVAQTSPAPSEAASSEAAPPPQPSAPATEGAAPATPVAAPDGSDPLHGQQWGLASTRTVAAWSAATGRGTVIAVVDTGVDGTHPDLAGRLVPGVDLVDPGTPAGVSVDPNGHGTHVAGIAAAATDNGVGISGTAPGAMIMPVRVLDATGAGNDEVIAEGIAWAVANGADVINLSLAESGFVARLSKNGPLNAAIREADAAGVVVVAAAGNDGSRRQSYRIRVPVLVVNASSQDGTAATFSNTGDIRAVAAPGVGILSTAPTAPTTIWPDGSAGYEPLDGTSMAAPLVAGIAAMLVEQGLSPAEVRDRIGATAVNPSADPALGDGIVDAAAAVGAAA